MTDTKHGNRPKHLKKIFPGILFLFFFQTSFSQYPGWNMDSLSRIVPFAAHLKHPETDSVVIYYDSLSVLYWKYTESEDAILQPLDPSSNWVLRSGFFEESSSHPYMSFAHSEDLFLVTTDKENRFSGTEIFNELKAYGVVDSLVHTGSFNSTNPFAWQFMKVDNYLIVFCVVDMDLPQEQQKEGITNDEIYQHYGYQHQLQLWYYFRKA